MTSNRILNLTIRIILLQMLLIEGNGVGSTGLYGATDYKHKIIVNNFLMKFIIIKNNDFLSGHSLLLFVIDYITLQKM